MILHNPSLRLTYTEDPTRPSLITDQYIVKHSIKVSERWLNGLESSSNIVTLELQADCPDILDNELSILKANSDIKAVLIDTNNDVDTIIFTGYISDSQNWTVTTSGEKALSITIEDVGTRLLTKPYFKTGAKRKIEGQADLMVREICNACGIVIDNSKFVAIPKQVLRVVEAGKDCKSLLGSLLQEVGYSYYFTNEGKLATRKIDCTSIDGVPVLNSANLYYSDGNALILQKKIRQYNSTKVSYNTINTRYSALVYKDISGQDDNFPDCNIQLEANQTYPDPNGADAVPSYVEAKDLTNGNKVVYIDRVVPTVTVSDGSLVTNTVEQYGVDTIAVLLRAGSMGAHITTLEAMADLTYIASSDEVIAGVIEASESDQSESMYEKKCDWIHNKEDAEDLAKLYVNYYKFCNRQFQFFTKLNLECGSIVKIDEDVHSHLLNAMLIIGKDYDDSSSLIKYTAVSVDAFQTIIPTQSTTIYDAPSSVNVPVSGNSTYFDVSLSSGIYRRNVRKGSKQTIEVSVVISGYSDTYATVTVNHGSFSDSGTDISEDVYIGQPKTLYIPYNNDYDSIVITGALNTGGAVVTKVISAVNETADWVYLGALNSLPTPATYGYDLFAVGDHFLAASNFSNFLSGNAYFYDGSGWQLVSSASIEVGDEVLGVDFYVTVMSNCTTDAADINTPTSSQLGSWIKKLVAKEIVANEILSKRIVMTSTGSIESANYEEAGGYPTSGYKLSSNDGTLRAMNAMLRDVNIKCTDSQNKVLLQTQRYQAGETNIPVRNTNLAARWCIDDVESSVTLDRMVACTYNDNSRYIWRPRNIEYTYGYRYLIAELNYSSGGHIKNNIRYGECLYTAPLSGNYYAAIEGYTNEVYPGYALDSSSSGVISNVGTMYVDLGYLSAGQQVLFLYCLGVDVYYYNEERKFDICIKNNISCNYTGNWWNYRTAATFTGYSYIPEDWIANGSAMSGTLVVGSFNSNDHKDYYAISTALANLPQGSYNTVNSSVTGDTRTISAVNIGKVSNLISFRDSSYNIIQVSLPVDTAPVATTGWYKNLAGTINFVSQQSGILTYNVLPSINQQCSCGTTGQAWSEVVSYGFNSLSARSEKKNIHKYEDNATDIINDTEIVSFNYKNKEDDGLRVGFIADDTNSLMAGVKHNIYDLNNCVGLLLKAVQELSARIEKLES